MRAIKIIGVVLIAALVVLGMAVIADRIAGAIYPRGPLSPNPELKADNIRLAVGMMAYLTAVVIVIATFIGVRTKKFRLAIVIGFCSLAGLLLFEVITFFWGGFGFVLVGSIIGAAVGSGLFVGYAKKLRRNP